MFAIGLRGWRCHRSDLPGSAGRRLGPSKLAVFVDGGFWARPPGQVLARSERCLLGPENRATRSEIISSNRASLHLGGAFSGCGTSRFRRTPTRQLHIVADALDSATPNGWRTHG